MSKELLIGIVIDDILIFLVHLLFQEVDSFSWITIVIIRFKAFSDLFKRKYFKSLFYNSRRFHNISII